MLPIWGDSRKSRISEYISGIKKNLHRQVKKDTINHSEIRVILDKIQITTNYQRLSDCNIIIHTNKSNPNFSITFKDIFPTILGSLPFDTNATSIDPIVCDATFKYTGAFTVKKLI